MTRQWTIASVMPHCDTIGEANVLMFPESTDIVAVRFKDADGKLHQLSVKVTDVNALATELMRARQVF